MATDLPRIRACATREPGPGELAERKIQQERKRPRLHSMNPQPPRPGELAALNAKWAAAATGHILAVIDGSPSCT